MTTVTERLPEGIQLIGYVVAILLMTVGAYNAGAGNEFTLWIVAGSGLTIALLLDDQFTVSSGEA